MFGLTPFNKNKGISRMDYLDDFFQMIDEFFDPTYPFESMRGGTFHMDLQETEQEYMLEADLPGCEKENIKIDFENGRLMVSVSNQMERELENENYMQKERAYSAMQRGVYLKEADGEHIHAKFEGGVLNIIVPKSQTPRSNRQIEID